MSRIDTQAPLVGIIMGSHSDYSNLRTVAKTLEDFGVSHRRRVLSVHRTPGLHH
jgi:5-(carboxyamino)imidazole ribonucleotide mutase